MNNEQDKLHDWAYFGVACFIASFVAYGTSLSMDFIGDDIYRVEGLRHIIREGLFSSLVNIMGDRPLLSLSIWLNNLLPLPELPAYRIVNVSLHALCAIVLARFWLLLLGNQRATRIVAYLAALIFAVHPANSQAVTTIIQRGAILSSLFSVLSLHDFIRAERAGFSRKLVLLSLLWFLLAILAKPNSASLPLMMLVYSVVLGSAGAVKKTLRLLPLYLLVVLIPVLLFVAMGENRQDSAKPAWQYFLTQLEVWLVYLKIWVWPVNLRFLYDIEAVTRITDPIFLAALAANAALFLFLWFRVRHSNRVAFFLALCAYLALLPESGFFPILHLAFEHRSYLPAAFALGMIPALCVCRWTRIVPLFTGLLLLLTALTWHRISEIDSYVKWTHNTLRYMRSNHDSNLASLSNLDGHGKVEDWKAGHEIASSLAREFPEIGDYAFYQRVFSHKLKAPATRTTEELDEIARSYLGAKLESKATAVNGIRFFTEAMREVRGPLEADIRLEKLYFASLHLLMGSDRSLANVYQSIARSYSMILNALHAHFMLAKDNAGLAAAEEVQWLRVRMALWFVFSVKTAGAAEDQNEVFREELARLEKKYPRRLDLGYLTKWFEGELALSGKKISSRRQSAE